MARGQTRMRARRKGARRLWKEEEEMMKWSVVYVMEISTEF